MDRNTLKIRKDAAQTSTLKALNAMKDIKNTLFSALYSDHNLNWESLKDFSKFTKPEPLNGLEMFIYSFFKIKKYEDKLNKYNIEKVMFSKAKKEQNDAVDELKRLYLEKDLFAFTKYCKLVLINSIYSFKFDKEIEIEYKPEDQMLIIEYFLPAIDMVPNIKEVKYVQTTGYREIYYPEAYMRKIYDNLLYQITLRSIYELFNADSIDVIKHIAFNGLIKTIDKASGHEVVKCILSIYLGKNEFNKVNLSNVDPKECFKKFKGVSASMLYDLIPIAPILQFDKNDPRFISHYNVAASLNESKNIAAMDWKDFEHLIREIFEKEFQKNGGEVKITRASRDAGVDAIAFDPDPIRGGKIVIQAKRYVNTVDVASVRDLYGTVVNEGAIKGILVTTSDFGADAYEFAKSKPITLLNGSHLLHLLRQYGYKARIDLVEAKLLLKEYK
jgi:restriction system protein